MKRFSKNSLRNDIYALEVCFLKCFMDVYTKRCCEIMMNPKNYFCLGKFNLYHLPSLPYKKF